ncbi:MAG: tRNA (adenosine(37)-N6)-threonylcarbamoyltransferase complex dimerization subunit type 1 TsaB [Succinatimonas sp.]|nr:tRNA (adenosine(37)-N6)-threonylcarbamoyltransferase complex dimerization subunit type 1 TsaB [Succinatimonas sp.]
MNLVAIDTSTENCSVAVLSKNGIKVKSQITPQHHAELVLEIINELLEQSCLELKDLDGIIMGSGPGSFTGVRIAASTAQGLALGLDLNVCQVSSLSALAAQALDGVDEDYAVAAIDARMGEVYIAIYKRIGEKLEELLAPEVITPDKACQKVVDIIGVDHAVGGGSGMELLYEAGLNKNIRKRSAFPDAEYILKLGKIDFAEGKGVDAQEALPLYVRNEVTWKKVSEQGK